MALFQVSFIVEGNIEKGEDLGRAWTKELEHYDFSIYDATLVALVNEGKRINLQEEN